MDDVLVAKEGYFYKKGATIMAGWKKRYFRLLSTKSLEYYDNDDLKSMKGTVNLASVSSEQSVIETDKVDHTSAPYGFCVIESKRTWYFAIGSIDERTAWINTIKEIINDSWLKKEKERQRKEKEKEKRKQLWTNESAGGWGGGGQSLRSRKVRRKESENAYGYDAKGAYDDSQSYTQEQKMVQIENRKKEALDSTLGSLAQATDLATGTADMLHTQGEQLINVDKTLHETEQDLDYTQHKITGMKSLGKAFLNTFAKNKPKRKAYEAPIAKESEIVREKGGMIEVKSNGEVYAAESYNEEGTKLNSIYYGLKTLNKINQDNNDELDKQFVLLNEIDDKMTRVKQKMKSQTGQMEDIGR